MPQSHSQPETQVEMNPPATDPLDAALMRAGVDIDGEGQAIKAAAAAEERHAAELIRRANNDQEPIPVRTDESLVSIMAKGRGHLLQRMREHAAANEAMKHAYTPPPLTDRQRSLIEAEQAAGRRARARHEEQLANKPSAKPEKWDGTNTPVHRPSTLVPDPTRPAPSGFAAGTGQYSPDA